MAAPLSLLSSLSTHQRDHDVTQLSNTAKHGKIGLHASNLKILNTFYRDRSFMYGII
jgi:hypothetical protein